MEWEIQLKNGRKFKAISPDNGETFQVQLSKGQKTYHVTEVTVISAPMALSDEGDSADNLVGESHNGKVATTMPIYHFLLQITRGSEKDETINEVRFITSHFITEGERNSYYESLATGRPVNGIFAIKTGNWHPIMLEKRLAGRNFRAVIVGHKAFKEMGYAVEDRVKGYTMAWASAEYSFYIKVEGESEFGLKSMGLNVKWAKKTAKRLNEVMRFTSQGIYADKVADKFFMTRHEDLQMAMDYVSRFPRANRPFVMAEFDPALHGMDEKLVDGISFISEEMVMASILSQPKSRARDRHIMRLKNEGIYRLNARWNGPKFGLKGDFIVLTRKQMGGADLIYPTTNKTYEVTTTGWALFTCMEHDPFHVASWDDQSEINNPRLLTYTHHARDIASLVADTKAIVTTGVYKSWMDKSEQMHDESGAVRLAQLSEEMNRAHVRWQAAGFSILDSQNFMYMDIGGIGNAMKKDWVGKDEYSDKMVNAYARMNLPMSNAFTGAVVSYSALTVMGGVELEHDPSKHYFDGRYGMIVPDDRFIDTFSLHGTWDQDDTAKYILIRLYGSKEAVANLKKDSVLPKGVKVPTNPDKAIFMVGAIRTPNSPGEYSLEELAGDPSDFPFYKGDVLNATLVNADELPRGLGYLMSEVTKTGIKSSEMNYGDEMTRENAIYMIEAQLTNPGIGSVVNALMTWANTVGVNFPPEMLDELGEMVDAVQQEADAQKFQQITDFVDSLNNQLVTRMISEPEMSLDYRVSYFRMNRKALEEVQDRVTKSRRMTKISDAYRAAYVEVNKLTREYTLKARSDLDREGSLVGKLRDFHPTNPEVRWARDFMDTYNKQLRQVDMSHQVRPQDTTFVKLTKQHNKKTALEQVVAIMVNDLESFGPDVNRRVLTLAKWVMMPRTRQPYGYPDRLIFQPGGLVSKSVMDLLIDAVKSELT